MKLHMQNGLSINVPGFIGTEPPRILTRELAREIMDIVHDDGWMKLKDVTATALPANGPQEQIRQKTD